MEQEQYVIRMKNGFYFAGIEQQGAKPAKIVTITGPTNAAKFPSRMAALAQMNFGIEFAGAAILRYGAASMALDALKKGRPQ
jgi:hypothetical protein